ncbi:hypothetical protein BV898_04105 [Hypsibius exemplaris]|uniref:Uncharacterized protein n=1 Tax=Hypsibius exemplaris TaxID=2072580 RepID=A0A1W0X3N0_HYPEX|nr:hypothetical protein BV898_04105 [Hypsibius exemplaris]
MFCRHRIFLALDPSRQDCNIQFRRMAVCFRPALGNTYTISGRMSRISLAIIPAVLCCLLIMQMAEPIQAACDGTACGCFKFSCWAYASANYPKQGPHPPWCYTQKLGVPKGQKNYASCVGDGDCSWSMQCGDDKTHIAFN